MNNVVKKHYCFQCGTQLELRFIEKREREVCPACGWIYYAQLKVGAAVLIEQHGKLLLLQRSYEPWKGTWMVPAGYVEADEDPKDAAIREVREETGLEVELGDIFHAYYFDDDPRGKGVAFVYKAEKVSGVININDESSTAKYFRWSEIPAELSKGGHDKMIKEWQSRHQIVSNERLYVSFTITGNDLDPNEITAKLDISPSNSFKRGDLTVNEDGRRQERKHGYWSLDSDNRGFLPNDPMVHFEWLLGILESVQEELNAILIDSNLKASVSCFWITPDGRINVEIEPAHLRRFAELNIKIWFDIYCDH